MIKEYFNNEINIHNKYFSFEELEKDSLKDLYIYLLIPNINSEKYDKLCNVYGNEKIDNLLNEIKTKIIKKKELYKELASKSIKNIKDKLNNKDQYEKDIYNMLKTSIDYLNNCETIIDTCLIKDKTNTKNR